MPAPVAASDSLSPAELIELTGTSRGILRVYERVGLIAPAQRTASGYRRYSREMVDQLRAIRTAKEMGFSLAEIGEMLGLGAPGMTQAQVRAIARERVSRLDERIGQLRLLRDCFQSYVDDPAQAFDPDCTLLVDLATARRPA